MSTKCTCCGKTCSGKLTIPLGFGKVDLPVCKECFENGASSFIGCAPQPFEYMVGGVYCSRHPLTKDKIYKRR